MNAPRWILVASFVLPGCTGGVSSDEAAEAACRGLDGAVDRGLSLGLRGYNMASSANIPDLQEDGASAGEMTIAGQVDQGESDNKGLRLTMALDGYSDTLGDDGEPDIVYDTDPDALPELNFQLRDIPEGTLEGTLVGDFAMDLALEGAVRLDLSLSGAIETDPDDAPAIRRVEGSTSVTGTATSDYGEYEVDLTL